MKSIIKGSNTLQLMSYQFILREKSKPKKSPTSFKKFKMVVTDDDDGELPSSLRRMHSHIQALIDPPLQY